MNDICLNCQHRKNCDFLAGFCGLSDIQIVRLRPDLIKTPTKKQLWYAKNAEAARENNRQWRKANRERVNEYRRRYSKANRERESEYQRRYRQRKRAGCLSNNRTVDLITANTTSGTANAN